jgi:cytochrome b
MKVWDVPTRLFHWAIVLLIATSYASVETGRLGLHLLSGYAMLSLLLFRLAWGFVGSETSRFSQFLRSPLAGFRHLRQFTRQEPDDQVGHNAAGGWMVLLMLALLAVQTGTGLFSNAGKDGAGPLQHLVSQAVSDQLSELHGFNFDLILAAATVHVVAIAAYAAIKRHNLLRPMITGRKRLPGATQQPRMASPLLALLLLGLASCLVWILATRV